MPADGDSAIAAADPPIARGDATSHAARRERAEAFVRMADGRETAHRVLRARHRGRRRWTRSASRACARTFPKSSGRAWTGWRTSSWRRCSAAMADAIDMTRICPPFAKRATHRCPGQCRFRSIAGSTARGLSRVTSMRIAAGFDVFHVVDHSYSQLVHRLPATRTVVTCHDLDTFRSILRPDEDRGRRLPGGDPAHPVGLQRAARDDLRHRGGPRRIVRVWRGRPGARRASPLRRRRRLRGRRRRRAAIGPRTARRRPAESSRSFTSGSTIPRKRIDTLLAGLRGTRARRARPASDSGRRRVHQRNSDACSRTAGSSITCRCSASSTIARWRRSTGGPRWCCALRIAKDSACRSSKPSRAGRRWWRATFRSCGRSAARRRICAVGDIAAWVLRSMPYSMSGGVISPGGAPAGKRAGLRPRLHLGALRVAHRRHLPGARPAATSKSQALAS